MLRNAYLVGLLVIGLGLGRAHGQPSAPDAAASPAPAGQHCAVNVDPVQPGAKASVVKEVGCFATFAEALAVATDGTVRVDPKMQPHEFTNCVSPTNSAVTVRLKPNAFRKFATGAQAGPFRSENHFAGRKSVAAATCRRNRGAPLRHPTATSAPARRFSV